MMKRIVLTMFMLVIAIAIGASKEKKDKGYAQATFEITTQNVGIIEEHGGPVKCEFEFTNTGNKPLIVYEVVTSCGCTKPDYPKNPIAPGKKGVIKVKYNPEGRPGEFEKDLKVKTNGREKRTVLIIEGVAVPSKK